MSPPRAFPAPVTKCVLDRRSWPSTCILTLEQVAEYSASSSSFKSDGGEMFPHHRYRITVPIPTTTIWQIRIVDSTAGAPALFFLRGIRKRGAQQGRTDSASAHYLMSLTLRFTGQQTSAPFTLPDAGKVQKDISHCRSGMLHGAQLPSQHDLKQAEK